MSIRVRMRPYVSLLLIGMFLFKYAANAGLFKLALVLCKLVCTYSI